MAADLVENPEIPYVGTVTGGLVPGKMVKVVGKVPQNAVRFAINYQLGPTLNPRDDIAIHLSPRFSDGFITRNHIISMNWGAEENEGPMWIQPGQEFEVILLCDHYCYKIAINGRHYTEFAHRLPYQKVTHLVIDGDVEVNSISWENVPVDPPKSPRSITPPDVPAANFGPPGPGGLYPTLEPQGIEGGYIPPPPTGYGPPLPGGYAPPPPGYGPPPNYGHEKAEEEDVFGGCLDKVGLALGGLVAAGGVAAAMHALNKKKDDEQEHEKTDASKTKTESESGSGLGNLGSLGVALASSLASNALQNNAHAQQGYPPQQSGGGGVLGSILGALGGSGNQQQPAYHANPAPAGSSVNAIESIIGSVLSDRGGGHQQPAYQPLGGYGSGYPSGGQGSTGTGLLSGIGSAISSSLINSAVEGLTKSKNKSHSDSHSGNPPYASPPPPAARTDPPTSGGKNLTADEISKGLGLDD